MATRSSRTVLALALALALVCAGGGAGLAQAAPPAGARPQAQAPATALAVPEGATGILAEFLAVCPAGIGDVPAAARLASGRGWSGLMGESALALLGQAAFGGLNLVGRVDGAEAYLTVVRREFADLTTGECELAVHAGDPILDTAVLAGIAGLRGGPVPLDGAGAERWSFRDANGVPVAIVVNRYAGQGARLAMWQTVPRSGDFEDRGTP